MHKFFLSFFFALFAVISMFGAVESQIVYDDTFTQYKIDSAIYKSALPHIEKLGLKAEDLLKMELPKKWYNQWSFFPANCTYEKSDDGFRIHSPDGLLYLICQPGLKFGNFKYIASLDIENLSSEKNAEIRLKCIDFSMLCADNTIVKTCNLKPNTRSTLTYEFSCRDGYVNVRPALELKGDLLLHRFRIEAVPESGVTCLEGTIVERSQLPDPATTNYPDCRYTIHFNGNAVLAGELCHRELALTIDGFRNKKLLKTDSLKKGDKIVCSVIPFADLPENLQETQVADDLNLFQLDSYYVLSVDKINEFSVPQSLFKVENQNYTSVFDLHVNPPIAEELVQAQQKQIKLDLAKMDRLLEGYPANVAQLNAAFEKAWKSEKAKDANGFNRVLQNSISCVWRNIDSSFWCLPEDYTFAHEYVKLINDEKLNALIAMKRFFEANGVQLIVSVVPHFQDIAARVMNPEFRKIPDYRTAVIVRQFLRAGIETVYPSDEIIANYNRYPFAFFFPLNAHPADTTQDVLAEMMAKRLERYHFTQNLKQAELKKVPSDHFYVKQKDASFYLFPENCDIGDHHPGTAFRCNDVKYKGKSLLNDKNSPVLILGNSFVQTPKWSTYPDLLSFYSGYSVEYRCNAYMGPMTVMLQSIFMDPTTYLKGKKVVILQMGATHFYAPYIWNNVELMDRFQFVTVGRNVVKTVIPSDVSDSYIVPEDMPDCHALLCSKDSETQIVMIDCSSLDSSKSIVCHLPYCVSSESGVSLQCNHQTQPVAVVSKLNTPWPQVLFELPAGTTEITLSISGPENATVFLQDIRILQ